MVTIVMLALATAYIIGLTAIYGATKELQRLNQRHHKPLYVAREALAQTGLAARNAYLFTEEAQARKQLDRVDQREVLYLAALEEMAPTFAGDAHFDKMPADLLAMAGELELPRICREAGQMAAFGTFLVEEFSSLRQRIVADIALLIIRAGVEVGNAETEAKRAEASPPKLNQRTYGSRFPAKSYDIGRDQWPVAQAIGRRACLHRRHCQPHRLGRLGHERQRAHGRPRELLFSVKTVRDSLASIVGRVR